MHCKYIIHVEMVNAIVAVACAGGILPSIHIFDENSSFDTFMYVFCDQIAHEVEI